jgi:ribosomal protein L21E
LNSSNDFKSYCAKFCLIRYFKPRDPTPCDTSTSSPADGSTGSVDGSDVDGDEIFEMGQEVRLHGLMGKWESAYNDQVGVITGHEKNWWIVSFGETKIHQASAPAALAVKASHLAPAFFMQQQVRASGLPNKEFDGKVGVITAVQKNRWIVSFHVVEKELQKEQFASSNLTVVTSFERERRVRARGLRTAELNNQFGVIKKKQYVQGPEMYRWVVEFQAARKTVTVALKESNLELVPAVADQVRFHGLTGGHANFNGRVGIVTESIGQGRSEVEFEIDQEIVKTVALKTSYLSQVSGCGGESSTATALPRLEIGQKVTPHSLQCNQHFNGKVGRFRGMQNNRCIVSFDVAKPNGEYQIAEAALRESNLALACDSDTESASFDDWQWDLVPMGVGSDDLRDFGFLGHARAMADIPISQHLTKKEIDESVCKMLMSDCSNSDPSGHEFGSSDVTDQASSFDESTVGLLVSDHSGSDFAIKGARSIQSQAASSQTSNSAG